MAVEVVVLGVVKLDDPPTEPVMELVEEDDDPDTPVALEEDEDDNEPPVALVDEDPPGAVLVVDVTVAE